jgi:hypothetical protein
VRMADDAKSAVTKGGCGQICSHLKQISLQKEKF